jgi:L-ascorbate metabolism protein UlaG (beta-lactamase superfamily)
MKISKHIHSCLLIEENGKTVLIDPGNYSVEGKGIILDDIKKLDYLLITHEHLDHMYPPFIKDLHSKFPDLKIISNDAVKNKLSLEGISVDLEGDDLVEVVDAPHEHVFGAPQFQNTLFNVFKTLTHPGDNLSFTKTSQILALPVQAPWGSLTQAVEKAVEVRPEYIIPIHDWHWNEEARKAFYTRLTDYFAQNGIKFLKVETGEEIEI